MAERAGEGEPRVRAMAERAGKCEAWVRAMAERTGEGEPWVRAMAERAGEGEFWVRREQGARTKKLDGLRGWWLKERSVRGRRRVCLGYG